MPVREGLKILIALEPASVVLAEVTVNAETGLDLLKKALAKIPENYDTSAVQFTAFYREQLKLADFELSYSESVLDIYRIHKAEEKLNDQIRIIKGRKKKIEFGSNVQLYAWISGISNGARGSLGEDQIKYNKLGYSPFSAKNYRYYNYDYVETIHEDDRDLVVIHILPKKKSRKAIFETKVFIDEESLAIVRCDYKATETGVRLTERKDKGIAYGIMSKVVGATLDYHRFEASVTYKQYNHKWYLSTVNRGWEILVNSKKRNMVNVPWTSNMQLMITDINTENVKPITVGNIGDKEGPITSFIGNDPDEAFWEHYNTLKSVLPDSLKDKGREVSLDTARRKQTLASNRQNGFTRADTLRGKLTPLRTCYDVTFYHLDVAIDMKERSVKGNNLIRFKVEQPFRKMQIDLYENMKIDKVVYKNHALQYTREFNAVFIDLPEMLQPGTESEIRIYYAGIPKTPDWSIPMNGGVLWDQDSLGNPWVQMVCQGSGASLWWPNKDHQTV
jgi:hypothetical protein